MKKWGTETVHSQFLEKHDRLISLSRKTVEEIEGRITGQCTGMT
jgi:hypothetical protein